MNIPDDASFKPDDDDSILNESQLIRCVTMQVVMPMLVVVFLFSTFGIVAGSLTPCCGCGLKVDTFPNLTLPIINNTPNNPTTQRRVTFFFMYLL